MGRKSFLRAALFAALFTALAAGASAQVTVSGGFALSSMEAKANGESIKGEVGFGGNIYADYLLPISVPLSLGLEVGIDTASLDDNGYKITGTAIPFLLRVAYHFDLMANLDLYAVGKIGFVLGSAEFQDGSSESGYNGVGFGFDVGAAYYFTPRFGAFAEAGFDRYNAQKEIDVDFAKFTVEIPFTRFLTFGISTKF
jgi:hypothetical protein